MGVVYHGYWYTDFENGENPNFLCNFQGAVVEAYLAGSGFHLNDIAVNEVVAGCATKVELPISLLNLFSSDTDVVQSLSG